MRLSRIEINILNNRLIDEYGDGDYIGYCEGVIVNRDSFSTINEMLSFLTKNYGRMVIA